VDGAIGRREEKARQGNQDGTHRDVRGARRAEIEDESSRRSEELNAESLAIDTLLFTEI
jgi:hypothetical protein